MSYETKISEMGKRAVDVGAKLATLAERRKQLAYDAVDDKAGVVALSKHDDEVAALRHEQENLTAAIAHAKLLDEEHKVEFARRERERLDVERRQACNVVLATDAEIDAAMNALRVLLERRAEQIRGLTTADSTLVLRLLSKVAPTAAARAAGLHNFMSVEHVVLQHVMSRRM